MTRQRRCRVIDDNRCFFIYVVTIARAQALLRSIKMRAAREQEIDYGDGYYRARIMILSEMMLLGEYARHEAMATDIMREDYYYDMIRYC